MSLPWAAYRALMMQQLVMLNKQPGVHPVEIGEIWKCLLAKMIVDQAGEQAKLACGSLQLWTSLEAGIEGTLRAIWKWTETEIAPTTRPLDIQNDTHNLVNSQFSQKLAFTNGVTPSDASSDRATELHALHTGKGFTIVNAANGFNELSHMAMLWTIYHILPKGGGFVFNCYQHKAMFIVRNPGHLPLILWSCEGFTQGDLMVMMLYGIALVSLVKIL